MRACVRVAGEEALHEEAWGEKLGGALPSGGKVEGRATEITRNTFCPAHFMLCYLRPAALFARRPARALSSRASTLTEQYDALVDRGELQYNPQQRELAIRLQQLRMELRKHSALTRGGGRT